jgi:hypothetical protein
MIEANKLKLVEKAILKKYENGKLFEIIILKNGNIIETITDGEKINAFNKCGM